MSDARRIVAVQGRRVWDSRGDPTLEIELRLASGACGRAMAPAGASTGRHEALELRDGGDAFGGRDVRRALAGVAATLAPALVGTPLGPGRAGAEAIDARIEALDPSPGFARLGGNVAVATSLAAHLAAADAEGVPPWRLFADGAAPVALPRPQIQIIGGGAHAGGRLDLQDLMVVPLGEIAWSEALDRVSRVHRAARVLLDDADRFGGYADEGGYWPWFEDDTAPLALLVRAIELAGLRPGEDMALSVDVAASQLAHPDGCRLALEDRVLSLDDFGDWLVGLVERFPIRLLEDPFPEDELDATRALLERVRGRCRIVGDDLVATSAHRIDACAGVCDAALIKVNQAGTVGRARAALEAARGADMLAITSARSGETEETVLVDLAIGWATPMIKVGALARGERTAKWNRGLRLAEALGDPPLAPLPEARIAPAPPREPTGRP